MSTTNFVNGVTLTDAAWFNDVDAAIYQGVLPSGITALTATGATTLAVYNTIATTLNIGGAATTINIGAATGTLTVNNATLAAKAITATGGLDVTGNITAPTNCAFLAYLTATSTNVTGAGTTTYPICNTEIFDVAGNYNNSTGIFTAPVTGKYQFSFSIFETGKSGTPNGDTAYLVTTARTYRVDAVPSVSDCSVGFTVIADMTAGETAKIGWALSGMAGDTADVYGAASSATLYTYFSGRLVQ